MLPIFWVQSFKATPKTPLKTKAIERCIVHPKLTGDRYSVVYQLTQKRNQYLQNFQLAKKDFQGAIGHVESCSYPTTPETFIVTQNSNTT